MNTEPHPVLTDADVLALLFAGCNEHEIQTYAGVSRGTAIAMILHAQRAFVEANQPTHTLRLPR